MSGTIYNGISQKEEFETTGHMYYIEKVIIIKVDLQLKIYRSLYGKLLKCVEY